MCQQLNVSNQDPVVEDASAACVVMVNEFATEGEDRPGLADPVSFTLKMACLELKNDQYSDLLIQNVAANCSNTIGKQPDKRLGECQTDISSGHPQRWDKTG